MTARVGGKVNLEVHYGNKPLELAKGKNVIQLASYVELFDTLLKVLDTAKLVSTSYPTHFQ